MQVKTELITLQNLLKITGLVNSGGEAKQIILSGLVKVNNHVELARSKKLYPGDKVEYNGEFIEII